MKGVAVADRNAAVARQARVFRALSHPERLAIVANLRNGPACVCHLAAALGQSQPYISQQLAILRRCGLIAGRRQGTYTSYELLDYGILGAIDLAARLRGRAGLSFDADTRPPTCNCPTCRAAKGVAG